jgi:cysteinyl-tRNA synthetase
MSGAYLGESFDIHGGGLDLVFPHHENEIAQSECANRAPFARYWMHNGFLKVEGEKMSKSLGNFFTVRELLDQAPGEAIRLAMLSTHYHQPLDWTADGLKAAKATLDRLYIALREAGPAPALEPPPEMLAALMDDLNTPLAIAHLHDLATRLNKAPLIDEKARLKGQLLGAGQLLGLLSQDPEAWLRGGQDEGQAARIEERIAARQAAKKAKNFALADAIRDALKAEGVLLEDGPKGTTWRRI